MKRYLIPLAACALALALAACKNESNANNTSSSTTSTSATDTSATTSTNDTSGTSGTSGTPGTTASTGTGTAPSTVSEDDKKFMTKAAEGGIAEVQLSTIAAQKATNADVKSFANRMVNDHGKANDELKQLAANKGVTLPTDTDKEHKDLADKLQKESGNKFDKDYMESMVKDHDKTVAAFEKESKDAKDADLKNWVSNTLPTLKDHQKMAKETLAKLK
jgi:putative membrane protein